MAARCLPVQQREHRLYNSKARDFVSLPPINSRTSSIRLYSVASRFFLSSRSMFAITICVLLAYIGDTHAHMPTTSPSNGERTTTTVGISAANAARMLAGSGGSAGNGYSLVLPHDTNPGFSIKKFKTVPVNESSSLKTASTSAAVGAYHMLAGDYSKYFTVLDDGVVMTTSDISPLVNRPVNIVVVEETPNATNTHNLQLFVMHRSDMLRFPGAMLDASGEVRENRPAGTRVRGIPLMQALSGDAPLEPSDGGAAKKVRYTIIDGNDDQAFALQTRKSNKNSEISVESIVVANDGETGVWLVTNRPLDREAKAHYDLSVQASDIDELDKTVSKIQVVVLDENDNRPIFKSTDYKFAIAGQKATDLESNMTTTWKRFSILGKVEATDADGDKIAYRLTLPSNIVIIVPQTGEIMLADQPQTSEMLIEVEAHDLRYPSLVSKQPAKVLIEFLAREPVSFIMQHLEHDAVNEHSHHREKRRVTRAVRPTKRIEFTEADGDTEGKSVFQLEKETDKETFKIRDDNPWVTVETNGAVRVKKKWDYEELGPEKTIDFWVIITNTGQHVAGIEFRHLRYLNEADIADAVRKVGTRAEFREKLFAWRKKNVYHADVVNNNDDQCEFHYVEYYYIPRNGKRPPAGKLYSKYTNISAKRRKIDGTAKHRCDILDTSTPGLENEFDESIETSIKEELRRESSVWEVVVDRWDRSYNIRQRDLKLLSNYDFIKEWPKLKDARGPELINADFKRMHPNKEHLLKTKWSAFKQNVREYYYLNIVNAACKSLLQDLSGVRQIADLKYTDNQRVIIHVKDVNDEPPYFINRPLPMQAVVQLNAPPNTPVFTLQARDPDTDHNIHYFIVRDRTGGRFEVDERSGVVRTRGTDLFQLDMEYVLYVKAEDQNGKVDDRRFQSTPEERLSIVGGKRAPQFYMPSYEAEIPENQKKDSDIISVKAKSFADREIRYTLKAQGQGAGTFNIGPSSGIVKLAKELDFEDLRQPHVYSLIVTATEDSGGFSTSVELTIRVTDVNDNAPKFELPDYQAHNVDEDIPLGTSILRVKAMDSDSGANAEIEYLVSDDHFAVDSNGIIVNNKQLDADNNNAYYEFIVTAKDKGEPSKSGTATVRVYTKNKNDEEPKFSQQVYTPNVDENAGPNTLVTTVVASDKDGDNVRFGFVGGGTSSGQFVIEEITGVIRLHNKAISLDRDKYELNVTAMDDGSCCVNGDHTIHTSTAVVVVFITDVNDNKPVFKDCGTYYPKVEEGAPNGSPVIKVVATDEDKGVNGQVKYSIVQQPNQKGTKFTVDEETGEVSTNKVFDREGDDGKFVSVTVKATDQGEPSLEGVCSFTVEITDVNDNPPLFDRQKYVENVKQDASIGTNILRVSASDEDADNNGAIVYSLSAPFNPNDLEYFDIQAESGWIVLKKPLDRDRYRLRVRASDRGEPPSYADVDVELDVVDRNNKPPIWDKSIYGPIHIRENVTVGTVVTSVKASSGIEGNPTVFYRLMPGSTAQTNKFHTFYLQQRPDNGDTWADIKVNHPLDYESIKEYNLTIRVENNGAQQLASEATVYIMLEDVNDEIPLFTEREQETVLEGEPIGTKVTQVNAIDKDGTFPNNQVYYYIVDSPRNEGKEFFEINLQSGEIFTKTVFDREKKGAYALEVEARDGAPSARPNSNGQPNSVTKFIRIGIADKNDNPPYFDKSLYEAEVDENEDIQHTVLTVTAKDHDESSRIRYEITSGNIGGAFAVKNMTGAIYVAGALDYETRRRYELRLAASDNLKENYTTVIIHVKDVNDNPPVFERPTYRTQITEEDDRNLPKRVLQYDLKLVASDSLNENSTTIVINVRDVNDLPPVFPQTLYERTLDEEVDAPFTIMQVTATDGDKDRPQNIVYFLTGQGIDPDNPANSKFDINRTTGEIFVLKPLDRDQPNGRPQWRFTVFAQDEGGEGLVGYADVQVNLKDINDNAPIFPQGVYFGNVTENGTAGMVVMTMTAVDYDDPNEGSNAKLVYSIEKNVIEEETGSPIFEIEPDTGVIKTAVCCLDRERTPDYSIQVVAMDGGGLKGTGTASIRVKDINDMPPQFTKDEWFTEVDETDGTSLPEMPILTVTVHDEDETNKFQYKVIDNSGYGADKFTMVRNNDGTGSLKIVQPLDYEDQLQSNGFRFRIQVNDKGEDNDNDKYHVAYSWVVVKLRDINDNKPHFERANVEVSVYEDTKVGTELEKFKATDPDQSGKSKVSYSIDRSSDRQRQFAINQNGSVTIQRSLDREVVPRHQVKILAIDDGSPPKTATATLTVIVQDINDNAPKFLKDYRPVLPEHVPPRKVVEILATDDDDRSKSNGPPFQFRLDPSADDIIRASFKVEQDQKGANGDGMAVISSLRSFDREQQKEYMIPIVIKDHGSPAMTGTSTLTVIIGDVNDNKMQPGSKDIFVYNYQGQSPDTQIGRVYVYDLDDWDLPDKKFYWESQEHPRFKLDEDTGMVTMRAGTREGRYHLRFKVYDRKHTQTDVPANITVTVREISHEAVINSGSIRVSGISDEDFIRVWNYRTQSLSRSKMDRFRDKLADLLNADRENVDIFSVQLKRRHPPLTDIRFSAHGSPYYKPVRLNGIVLMNREEIEKDVGFNITMVGIDECLYENQMCEGSCTNTLDISSLPYMVNANKTALVGVRVDTLAECTCGARNFSKPESCRNTPCYNGGRCVDTRFGPHCSCPAGYNGPRCQQTTRSFRGNGWAWYPPLEMCDESHLSLEFITRKPDGLFIYNGPIVPPEREEMIITDYIALELERGYPRLLIDFGSGTLELRVKTKKSLDDGEWHRIDVFWNTENVRMVIDFCKSADISEMEDGTPPEFDDMSCQARGQIPPFNEYLNVNGPLQVGGIYRDLFDPSLYFWHYAPNAKAFDGCIRNLVFNSKLYDLAHPGLSRNSVTGCQQTEEVCSQSEQTARCWEHGNCVGSLSEARCQCRPGWTGPACNIPTIPTTFKQQSYVKYALSFEPDRFSTQIQLRFRTREQHGELFRVSDQHNREYGILEIKDARLHFRYNLNSLRTEEKDLWLNAVAVDDGQWHVVRINRYGSAATLELDGGEGRRYNETFEFVGHQWLLVDKQEGVYAGGKAEYTGVRTFEVYADYQKSCLDDIRLEGKHLPLPPAMNGTQWGQATMARNLEKNCPSNKPCSNVICPEPFECVDLWNEYECTCPAGFKISGSQCVNDNECLQFPCRNGGRCRDHNPPKKYECNCPMGFTGMNCELELLASGVLTPSRDFIIVLVLCTSTLILLVLVFVVYNRRREAHIKYPGPDDDVRENIINYDDEGGGEDDMTAFDITPLQIPIGGPMPPELAAMKMPIMYPVMTLMPGQEPNVGMFIEEHKKRADGDPNAPPFDDLRNYAYEGGGSTAGSLSSLASGTDDETHEYDYLGSWGPRFGKLANMYGDEANAIAAHSELGL